METREPPPVVPRGEDEGLLSGVTMDGRPAIDLPCDVVENLLEVHPLARRPGRSHARTSGRSAQSPDQEMKEGRPSRRLVDPGAPTLTTRADYHEVVDLLDLRIELFQLAGEIVPQHAQFPVIGKSGRVEDQDLFLVSRQATEDWRKTSVIRSRSRDSGTAFASCGSR